MDFKFRIVPLLGAMASTTGGFAALPRAQIFRAALSLGARRGLRDNRGNPGEISDLKRRGRGLVLEVNFRVGGGKRGMREINGGG